MRIRKWYSDCTAGDGTVFIGYAGTLGLGPWIVPVQSCTVYPAEARPRSRWRLGRASHRIDAAGDVHWTAPSLGVHAHWSLRSRPIQRLLLDTPRLRIEWRCHVPRARARVQVGPQVLEGWGYVEEMIIDGDVRRLPLKELHWGRFHTEEGWTAWLDWKGPCPLTVLLENGRDVRGRVSREAVTLDDGRMLPLGGDSSPGVRVLADQRVGDTFFPTLPPLRWILPRILTGLHERKLAGLGRWVNPDGSRALEGRLLYETVEFP